MTRYPLELEAEMRAFYDSLSEKDRRRYAAIESRKLGYGGHSYIARVLGCERHTVATGIAELRDPCALEQLAFVNPVAGVNRALKSSPSWKRLFSRYSPSTRLVRQPDEKIKWTNLTRRNRRRSQATRHHGGVTVVKQLLLKHDAGGARRKSAGNRQCRRPR
ncbi:MAG: hypothetical protein KIT57_11950 [Blastocatellales bacterium]|nr:hypothetical protein [Blastocatellales bacterium]